MGREFELKYTATPAQLATIAAAAGGGFEKITMETTYYDTAERVLSAQHYTLRRRIENGISVCTVKTPADEHGRGEWECLCDVVEASVSELCKLGAPETLQQWAAAGLQPVCGARFTRLAKTVELGDAIVELALDSGVLLGGNRQKSLCEVEVELKSGSEKAAKVYAAILAERFDLKVEKKSKFRRALALAEG